MGITVRAIADTMVTGRFDFSIFSDRIISGVVSWLAPRSVDLFASNLRGYSGGAKIFAEPPSSITGFWIYIATSVMCFAGVIMIIVVQPNTQVKRAPDDTYDWAAWKRNQAHTALSLGFLDRKE